MKKIVKMISLILAMMLVFGGLSVSASAAGESSLTINVYDGFAVVAACRQNATGVIDIPSTYGGVPVTNISDGAFSNCNAVTQVNIPASVKKVGSNAFDSCIALKKINFESSVCTLGESVFAHCSALTDITLPSALTVIPENAFFDCGALVSVIIPDTVTTIEKEAFKICSSVKTFDIPASVTEIGKNAFIGCASVTAYNVAGSNAVYSSVDGVLYGPYSYASSDKTLIQYPIAKKSASYIVQSGTLVIGDSAFGGNTRITSVVLPNGLKRIDSYAFNECTALASVSIPSTVTKIGSLAFGKCAALENITIPASVTDFNSAFYMSGLKKVTLGNGIKTISAKAFEKCASLESVTIPESVTKIDLGAFDGCTKLGNVDIPDSVTSIGSHAFANCPAVKLLVTKGSVAHTYAVSNNIRFELKSGNTEPTNPPSGQKTIVSVSVEKLPDKTSYNYKDAIDTTGLELEVVYSDGSREIVDEGYSVSPATCAERGTQTVKITYQGKTTEFDVSVSFAWWQWIIWFIAFGFLWY